MELQFWCDIDAEKTASQACNCMTFFWFQTYQFPRSAIVIESACTDERRFMHGGGREVAIVGLFLCMAV